MYRGSNYRRVIISTNLILQIYKDLGFKDVILKYSDRPKKRVGNDDIWDKSETALLAAIKNRNLNIQLIKERELFMVQKSSLF